MFALGLIDCYIALVYSFIRDFRYRGLIVATTTNGVAVKILGKDYQVACPQEQTHHLLDAALLLDGKMKDIKASGRIIGLDRIAVMAALNLAHELLSYQHSTKAEQQAYEQQISEMCNKLQTALAPA